MSGTFERQRYDIKAYEADLKQSTGPLHYYMNPIRNDTFQPARISQPGFTGRVGVSVTHTRPLIDVESDLLNLDLKNSKDPNKLYRPRCPQCGTCKDSGYPCGNGLSTGCSACQEKLYNLPRANFNQDYTRISNPICTSREVGINRFQSLNLNPQDEKRWKQQSEVGINYRMIVKDNHVPKIPKFHDHSSLLPTGSVPVLKLMGNKVSHSHIHPLHKYGKAFSTIKN